MEKKRILVIDDDATVLDVLKTGLEQLGYSVDTSETTKSAIEQFNNNRPDAVLLDVRMPDLDGISFCHNIKVSNEAMNVPILIITAYDDDSARNDALLFGACDFILKPFEISEIQEKIEKAIEKFDKKKESEQ